MDYYGRDLRKALLDVFPEIEWLESNFTFKNSILIFNTFNHLCFY